MDSFSSSRIGFWLAGVTGVLGARLLLKELTPALPSIGVTRQRKQVEGVAQELRGLEETLSAGMVPESRQWDRLSELPRPWGSVASTSIRELRATGGALLPTLGRLRSLAEEQVKTLVEAKAKGSQAMVQALCCGAIGPGFGALLYWLMPGVSSYPRTWVAACAFALACSGAGALWMLSLMEKARWAGLPEECRNWIFAAQCAGERFLAVVRGGNPADLAWTRAGELLLAEAPGLAAAWGASVWATDSPSQRIPPGPARRSAAARALVEAGGSLRKAVQLSLMEGRPCVERVESALEGLRHELAAHVEKELSLLSTRALLPLFACVAPGVLGLLAFGFYLSFIEMGLGV